MSQMFNAISIGDLAGKAVLVTGGSTGIGAAVVSAFAQQKCRVGLHYNSSLEAAEKAQAPREISAARSFSLGATSRTPPMSVGWSRTPPITSARLTG
jgi:NAD(P)-dependent dehydrogenase (short-subunit alcohol dehydrogenase family)